MATTAPSSPILAARRLLMIASQVQEFTSDKTSANTLREVAEEFSEGSRRGVELREDGVYSVRLKEGSWKRVSAQVGWDLADVIVAIHEHGRIHKDEKASREWAEDTCKLLREILTNVDKDGAIGRCVWAAIYGTGASNPQCAACGSRELKDGWVVLPADAIRPDVIDAMKRSSYSDVGDLPPCYGPPIVIDAPEGQSLCTYSFGYRVHPGCLRKATREATLVRLRARIREPLSSVLVVGIVAVILLGLFVLDSNTEIVTRDLRVALLFAVLLVIAAVVGLVKLEDPDNAAARKAYAKWWRQKYWSRK